ncbi:MAG: hypothetical protein ATN31_02265 [Candidatus Epulonipiscioides saccharophilum]|nr:MAG: hypothetical protein ATN31_02265 [Epulopiscium sp. AS2M-Bin001]
MRMINLKFALLVLLFISIPIMVTGDTINRYETILYNLEQRTMMNNELLNEMQRTIDEIQISLVGPPKDNYEQTLEKLEKQIYLNLKELEEIHNELNGMYKNLENFVVSVKIDMNTSLGTSITYGGEVKDLELLTPPYIENNQIMLGVRDVAYLFDVEEEDISFSMKNDHVHQIFIRYDECDYEFTIGSYLVRKDETTFLMNAFPVISYGYTYLPLEDVAIIFDSTAIVQKNTITIVK